MMTRSREMFGKRKSHMKIAHNLSGTKLNSSRELVPLKKSRGKNVQTWGGEKKSKKKGACQSCAKIRRRQDWHNQQNYLR